MVKDIIEFEEFIEISNKLHIRVGKVETSEKIEGTDKLLKLSVLFNEGETKTCVTNLGGQFDADEFVGKTFPFVMNLKPSKMRGVISEVMIMPTVLDTLDYDEQIELGLESTTVGSRLL